MTIPARVEPPASESVGKPVDVSLVVPTFNERESLRGLFEEIERTCAAMTDSWEVAFVDDGSTDGSSELLSELARTRDKVRVVHLRRNFGKSVALRAGIVHTSGEVVVTLDADGQDDPAEIPNLVAKLREGYDVVSGWKQDRNDPFLKRCGSRVFNRLTARLSGVPLHDVNCGLKAYRGDAIRELDLYGEQHRLVPVLGFQRGWRVTELPVQHRARAHGRSKFGPERYARGLLDLMSVVLIGRYQYRPLHLFGGAGLISLLIGTMIGAYLTVQRLSGHAIGTRPLLDLAVLLVLAGIQLFTIGLLAEMITATRQDARIRQELGVVRETVERDRRNGAAVGGLDDGSRD
ncbi:MAG: glycosyltransferase family 2 protein [Solirubrobacteraceae bacterium]